MRGYHYGRKFLFHPKNTDSAHARYVPGLGVEPEWDDLENATVEAVETAKRKAEAKDSALELTAFFDR